MERAPKDVRATGYEIPANPRKPCAETGIKPGNDEPFCHHDALSSATHSTSGSSICVRLNSRGTAGPFETLTAPAGIVKMFRCRTGNIFRRRSLSALCANARCRGARAHDAAVDLVRLQMHRCAVVALGADLDARRVGEVLENIRWFAFGKLGSVEIDPHLDAAIGRPCERLLIKRTRWEC